MWSRLGILVWFAAAMAMKAEVPEAEKARREFRIKQVAGDFVYLDGGTAHGLKEGMRLKVERRVAGQARMAASTVGEVRIVSVASQSSLAEWIERAAGMSPAQGDVALLSAADAEARQRELAATGRKRYAQVISFSSGDPLEEEVREYVPHPPLKEEGRLHGRIGFEWNRLADADSGTRTYQEGLVVRMDWTRIEGSYWSIQGYWRGRWNRRGPAGQAQTLTDLINRTYTLGLYYSNPRSKNQLGFGRILLPWASSLSTLDGGYYARRLTKSVTAGVFAGSTPDPAQWNYDPDRQILGVFTSAERGSYDKVRWMGTVGAAVTRVRWRPERNFLFLENNLFAGPRFSLMHSLEADRKNPRLMNGQTGTMLSRSFLTVRLQPHRRISFDLNHNYFRGLPTFDSTLLGTGLLDRFLFQGFSGGLRVSPLEPLSITANWGRSRREGDSRASLNQMYSAAWRRLPWIGARIDGRYTRFSSSFGRGSYESVSLTREVGEGLRLEVMAGQQFFDGGLSRSGRARFVDARMDWDLGLSYFLSAGWLRYRGQIQNYDQMFLTLGYRF